MDAEVVGLENRFKSEKSLARKLSDYSTARDIPVEKIAGQINDTLRYTLVFSPEYYSQSYNSSLSALDKKGYEIQKIWNAWSNEGKPNDTGYRGINATVISSQKQKFEIQFHTVKSFRLKTETHGLYEERRNPQITKQRGLEISEIMKGFAAKVQRPEGI